MARHGQPIETEWKNMFNACAPDGSVDANRESTYKRKRVSTTSLRLWRLFTVDSCKLFTLLCNSIDITRRRQIKASHITIPSFGLFHDMHNDAMASMLALSHPRF